MAKKTGLDSWAAVDAAIMELGECERRVTEIELELNRQTAELTKAAGEKSAPLVEQQKALTAAIKKFVKIHKAELDGKSKKLNHGETGFRASTKCVIPKNEDKNVIKMLKKLDMLDCLIIDEKVNRDVLKTYPEGVVAQTGARLEPLDTFWVEPHQEKLKG